MTDLYVNKNGFKCVPSQLAKTEGRDPQEFEELKRRHGNNDKDPQFRTELGNLKVREEKYK